MNINLKPCPFCGGEAELIYKDCDCFVKCTICHARTMLLPDEQRALHFWNTRKLMDKIVEQLEMTADAAHDEIMARQGSEQYYDGYEDGVNAAIEIIKEEINSKFEEKKI